MSYLACATFPDTDHVRDAILALEQYNVPRESCGILWLQAGEPTARDHDLAAAAGALAPVAIHATADGPIGAAGTPDPPPGSGWLARLLRAEGVPADEAAAIERRVLAGEVLLTVRAEAHTAALEQLLGWTGAYRYRPRDLFAPDQGGSVAGRAATGTAGRLDSLASRTVNLESSFKPGNMPRRTGAKPR